MTKLEIIEIQKEIGTAPDGLWGPKSKASCQKFLRSLCANNPWPSQANRFAFFGPAGSNLTSIDVSGIGLKYEGRTVNRISCNMKIAQSLHRILHAIAAAGYTHILQNYAGCYADKALMHGVGAAIDFDPDDNSMSDHWPTDGDMPWGVVKIFAREGWTSGGAFWGYDGMHFQATTW